MQESTRYYVMFSRQSVSITSVSCKYSLAGGAYTMLQLQLM